MFTAYGYQRFLAHPRLEAHDDKLFVPDFLVEDLRGFWQVFELKRPDTPVIKPAERRQTFYAEFEKYLSQCREYAAFFEDRELRTAFNTRCSTAVQKSVPSVIVAGRRSDVDVASVQRLLFDRGSKVDLQTYDDVATRLEFYRAQLFARNENNPGLSIHIVAVLGKQPAGDNYILDYGLEADRNRVSIYVSPDDTLRFRVIDQAGVAHSTSVNMDMANVLYDVPVYLVFELGFAEEYTFTCIEVNGEYYADRRLDQVVLDSESLDWQVMGSDVLGKKLTEFSMIELAVYSRSLAFTEKLRLRGYFFQRYYHCMDGSGVLPARVSFSGNQFLYSSGHPNFLEGGQ